MNVEDVKQLLNYKNKIELIGSNKLNLKYPTDYDYQVKYIIKPKNVKPRRDIVKHFQNIFKVVSENDKMIITDFKSGIYLGPIRWKHDEVMKGEKEVNPGVNVSLMYNLDHCKIDLIVYTGEQYDEFSCNYYFFEEKPKDVKNSLMMDIKKYYHENKYMKVLKRVLSYRLILNKNVDDLIEFFNGEAGRLYQEKHKMEVRQTVGEDIDQKEIDILEKKINNLVVEFIN